MAAFRSLRYRDYRLFWFGAFASNTGTWMQNIALSWYVLQLTGSAFWVGAINFANFIPMWFSPLGGVLADRMDRKKILLATQSAMLVAAVGLAIVTQLGTRSVVPAFLLTLFTGMAFAVDAPTRNSFFPKLVPAESMVNAIALNSAQFSLARVVGPTVAGAMVATVGVVPVFWINAASFLAVLAALAAIRSPFDRAATAAAPPARLRDGLAYAWRHPLIRTMLVSIAILSLFGGPVAALLPVFAREVYGRGPRAFGHLTAALGIGSVIGAMALSRVGRVRPGMVGGGLVLSGVALIALGSTTSFAAGLAMMLVFGGSYLFSISATNSQIQTSVDDLIRGRVVGLFLLAFGGLFPVGSLVAGTVADHVGVGITTIGGASLCLAWGILLLVRTRRRDEGAATAAEATGRHGGEGMPT
ncbi:MAG: MFS transporter [Actinomycetota bacterium]